MDKQNYTLSGAERQEIKQNFRTIRCLLIKKLKKTQIIKRKRIIKDYETLVQAVFLYIAEKLSFQQLSDIMACKYGICMSDTAWKKQILKAAPSFLEAATECLCEKTPVLQEKSKKIYALDATNIATEGINGTVIRVHTQLSLSDCICFSSHITNQHTAESVRNFTIEEGAVYLADRAYGKASQFAYMLEHNANFIFRISPSQIRLYKEPLCKERLDVQQLIENTSFSCMCYFRYNKKIYRMRLIGTPLPEEKRKEAEKRVCRKANKNQRKIRPQTVLYSSWVILATSLPDAVSVDKILETYRLRWQIELLFKRAKTHLRFHKIRRSSYHYISSVVSLWVAIALLLSLCQYSINQSFSFDISLFNSFALAKFLFS